MRAIEDITIEDVDADTEIEIMTDTSMDTGGDIEINWMCLV
ncbi:hypothetical protein GCM10022218_37730 [Sphingobacterium ginsenosidimutans]|uniref:Uncharacterized protein n=1 Tax=Sphingobacterium ginsenosidimutans TaxID=687845 RepID=A0ABP8ACF3_9SPHI